RLHGRGDEPRGATGGEWDRDREEDALILHPRGGVDHRPEMERVDAGRLWRSNLERERAVRTWGHARFCLRRDAVSRHPVPAVRRPLRIVLVDPEPRLLSEHA